ncbi:Hypothetical protein SRAE_1000100500 [Strongyloides ratti]|uniref:Uncharacterized protein n=1 Tax=Strongyloides ratti TaxID=34506 RepID=A0A090KZ15_STRRB|nr:Hypothetical protein SRAE_1000100500 [Strongyloides ratti]CEF62735.1 Hypothetical protein SRAE_1000100500 [Strongyloides ratti]
MLILISGIFITLFGCYCFAVVIFSNEKVKLKTFSILCFIIQNVMLITHVVLLFKHLYLKLKATTISD